MPTKKHAYAGLPPSEKHASQGKNVRTNTRNSAFPRALKRVEIHVVLGCIFNFMMCSKVIYTGLIKTEISNWNSDGYFHRACAICEKSWWKVREKSS